VWEIQLRLGPGEAVAVDLLVVQVVVQVWESM
jgi:hypothetical protein